MEEGVKRTMSTRCDSGLSGKVYLNRYKTNQIKRTSSPCGFTMLVRFIYLGKSSC